MSVIRTCRQFPRHRRRGARLRVVVGSSVAAGLLAVLVAGCGSQDEPRHYQEPQTNTTPAQDTPAAAAAPQAAALTYDTPKGWVAGAAGGMRKAAFVVQDGDRKVEITVIDLAAQAGALLPNVNIWRQQIQLPETTQSELEKSVSRIPAADVEGTYVELLGPEGAGARQAILAVVAIRGGKAWFFKLKGDAKLAMQEKSHFQEFVKSVRFEAPKKSDSPAPAQKDKASPPEGEGKVTIVTEADDDGPPLKYDAPRGWTSDEPGGSGRATLHVADGDRKAEVSVLHLPGRVENLLLNVNRWRHQVQLNEVTQADLAKLVQPIQVDGKEGQYIEFFGPESAKPRLATIVVLVDQEGKSWMFRMTGDGDLILREKDRFQGFVKSFKLPSGDKDNNGH